jgi:hypothetical protein
MSYLVAEENSAFPLTLVVSRAGIGGVTGLAPTVALRQGAAPDNYLDWNDGLFKSGGWTTKYGVLSEVERGHYQRMLDLDAINVTAGTALVAQFSVDNGGDVRGEAEDVVLVVPASSSDVALLRKALTNRMDETAGSPGQLTLFDDDGFTILMRWELRDAVGGAIVSTVGTPARRSARIP